MYTKENKREIKIIIKKRKIAEKRPKNIFSEINGRL